MDNPRFDGFARTVATRLTRRTGLGLLAGASSPFLGLTEAADAKKKKKTMTLCFNGQTVKKPKKKAKKLQKKGATKGTCEPLRCGNGGPCTVFMTKDGFDGAQIRGLDGGDAKCQAAADASTANLTGTFKAWLSDGSETPGTRFSKLANAGPYRLVPNVAVDGGSPPPLVATDFADLLSCGATCLQSAINRNQDGQVQGGNPGVWTGTFANGNVSADTCEGWTSDSSAVSGMVGTGTNNATLWTENAPEPCNRLLVMYCFQQAT